MPASSLITQAALILRSGGLVAFPTETVYGLGANALSPDACLKIFAAKGRPLSDPLIVHVSPEKAGLDALQRTGLISSPDGRQRSNAQKLIDAFWPGPVTLLLPRGEAISPIITAGRDGVAIRVPAHPMAQALLREADIPVAAPSANRFGRISPTTAGHVREELGDRVDMVLDGGPCEVGVESTIVDLLAAKPALLRHGGVSREDLERVLGTPIEAATRSTSARGEGELAPGMLEKHYAPLARLSIVHSLDVLKRDAVAAITAGSRVGVLLHSRQNLDAVNQAERFELGNDLPAIARNLFAGMRALDAAGVDRIFIVAVPPAGLGAAIADRLQRAAA